MLWRHETRRGRFIAQCALVLELVNLLRASAPDSLLVTCIFEGFGLTTLPGLLALLRTLPAILPMPPLAVCSRACAIHPLVPQTAMSVCPRSAPVALYRCISPYSLH